MRVACETHRSVVGVADDPFALTFWTALHLNERDEILALRGRARDLHLAGLVAIAFHEPNKLKDEHRAFVAELEPPRNDDDVIDSVADVMEAMRLIDAGKLQTTVLTEVTNGN